MSQLKLEHDWDEFCRLEDEIGGAESTGISTRWQCGQMLRGYEKGQGREWSELGEAVTRLSSEFGCPPAELYDRRKFAVEYPTQDDLSAAIEKFNSWDQIRRKGLGKRGGVEPPPPPEGEYRCIVIDPPWPMEKIERDVRPAQTRQLDYAVMSLDEIAELVGDVVVAQSACHVYLWVTQRFLPDGLDLFEKWGVDYQCLMTWVKNVGPTPFSWMYDTEHVLFGRRGSLGLEQLGLRLSFSAPTTHHSEKPAVFYERVCVASPGPRLDMFARRQHEGFEAWGAEVAA